MKILILSASVGSGHRRAAQAVECALQETYPEATVQTMDILNFATKAFRKVYGDGYFGLASSAPHLLGYLYDATDSPAGVASLSDSMRRLIQRWSLRSFMKFLKQESWDVIINTHFLPAEMIAMLKRAGKLDIPQICVVTDFEVHRLWVSEPCDHFFTATKEGAASLRYWGVDPKRISISGIPIAPVFSGKPSRAQCLKSQGIIGGRPIILQLAGGSGLGPIDEIYAELLKVNTPSDIVVVAGHNKEARYRLLGKLAPARHRVRILGYTDKIHELMAVADLLVSKPGGLTVSEAMAYGLPLVAVNPIPGQETRNCDFLLENGAGVKINAISSLPEKVNALLGDPMRLKAMRDNALRMGRPEAAFLVARKAVDLALAPEGELSVTQILPHLLPMPTAVPASAFNF